MVSHLLTLRLSAEKSSVTPSIESIVDDRIDSGVPGGKRLIRLGRSAAATNRSQPAVQPVAEDLGPAQAVTAIELVAGFEMVNRAMEATGQPVDPRKVELTLPALRKLGAHEFPHAAHVMPREGRTERLLGSVKRRVRRR